MEEKKVRIVDIARLAGVSPGTVDRVIHNRGRIAPDKKRRIEEIIAQLGYQPNIAARLLATGQSFTIAVVAPSYVGESYWKQVSDGMMKAAEELGQYNQKIEFLRFDQYDRASFDVAVADVAWEAFDGVVIATLFEEQVKSLSAQLDAIDKPYIYIDSQVEGQNDLAYFGVDAQASGYIAGKMLCRELADDVPIVITHVRFRRNEISTQMRRREQGLLRYLREVGRADRVEYIEHEPELGAVTVEAIERLAAQNDKRVGLVVLNSRLYELVEFLRAESSIALREKFMIVGFEAIKPNIEAMNRGDVDLLISSDITGLRFYGLVEELRSVLHKKVDLLTLPQLVNNPELLDEVLKDGVKVYG